MKIVTASEMKSLDHRASSEYKIPSLLLMENAARGLVDEIEKTLFPVKGKRVCIISGRGNNGGDGLAAARHLRMRGASVCVFLFSEAGRISGDAKISLDIWRVTEGELYEIDHFTDELLTRHLEASDLLIDAFLGTGLSKPLSGDVARWIDLVNAASKPTVAVDIPSGISADFGHVLGVAIKADLTVTIALPKRGHYMQDGLTHCGSLSVVDIGFPDVLLDQANLKVSLITPDDVIGMLPSRKKGAHKGTMGHLLVIAGSLGKQGAPQMTALAALRSGAGLVTLALPQSIEKGVSLQTMELMTLPLPESGSGSIALSGEKEVINAIEGKRVVAIGPGLSQDPETQELIKHLITKVSVPLVIDADGINALATDLSILKQKKGPVILTPHPGEMGRLMGLSAEAVQKDRFNIAAQFAKEWGVILVLKGPHSIISLPEGLLWVNNTGNPGMATSGIGDALTGMIAACIAQGLSPEQSAILGVYLHGLAGDLAAAQKGEAGLITSDLIHHIPHALKIYLAGNK